MTPPMVSLECIPRSNINRLKVLNKNFKVSIPIAKLFSNSATFHASSVCEHLLIKLSIVLLIFTELGGREGGKNRET